MVSSGWSQDVRWGWGVKCSSEYSFKHMWLLVEPHSFPSSCRTHRGCHLQAYQESTGCRSQSLWSLDSLWKGESLSPDYIRPTDVQGEGIYRACTLGAILELCLHRYLVITEVKDTGNVLPQEFNKDLFPTYWSWDKPSSETNVVCTLS